MKTEIADSTEITVAEWAEAYLRQYVQPVVKPSSAEHYADNLLKHFVPSMGDVRLADLDAVSLQKFFNEQAGHGSLRDGGPLSPKSLRNLRTAVSACLAQAVTLGIIPFNPVKETVIKRGHRPRIETMSDEGVEALLDFAYSDGNLMNAGIILGATLIVSITPRK